MFWTDELSKKMELMPIKEFSITGDEFSVIYQKHSLEIRNGLFEVVTILHNSFKILRKLHKMVELIGEPARGRVRDSVRVFVREHKSLESSNTGD